jgi:ferredoxin-NADP reductase/Na+-translocating ferredoxin:NAD+ oxidoreductase RnfD subunit
MTNTIDDFLNGITMYRLVLYYLIALISIAFLLTFLNLIPFSAADIIFSTAVLVAACLITNTIFAKVFKVVTNIESVYISSLILALIISPPHSINDVSFLIWASILSMASKYILAIRRKHIFNPAAFAVAFTALTINQSASWWVGNLPMLPFVLIGGLLVVRKLRRFAMVATFLAVSVLTILLFALLRGTNLLDTLKETIVHSPLTFFAFVMLTEPQTTPPKQKLRVIYGGLVGLIYYYQPPEIALLLGNIYSYIISPKERLALKLKERIPIAKDAFNFVFTPNQKLKFLPGQYMEWTLGHSNPDSRGNRRYFTIASSPLEKDLLIGVKFPENPSSFKKKLLSLNKGEEIIAGQLSGDFVLPEDPATKLVFMAGGIGITPFRSMIKYLLEENQKRSITVIYSNREKSEIAYSELLNEAKKILGIKVIYWDSSKGHIDGKVIEKEVPDFLVRTFYLSGSHGMVTSFEKVLQGLGVMGRQIKTDFFPGYA